jgi:hypothetical protein
VNTGASAAATVAPSKQQYFVVALLLLALPIAYFARFQPYVGGVAGHTANAADRYVADLDFWQRTARETVVTTPVHFDLAHDLDELPLTVGKWQGENVPETNQEVMILLDPEQYILRLYQRETGEYLWLSMIGGRSSQPFHAPDICYDADGWQYDVGSHPIELENGGKLYGLWLDAEKAATATQPASEHIVFYFYLFPTEARQLSDGIVLFKLTSGRHGTVEETLALHADFIRNLFSGAQAPIPAS